MSVDTWMKEKEKEKKNSSHFYFENMSNINNFFFKFYTWVGVLDQGHVTSFLFHHSSVRIQGQIIYLYNDNI